jgi:hypothetical protein
MKAYFKKLITAVRALLLRKLESILINDMYCAYHGMELYLVLWDLDQYLRDEVKHNDREDLQEVRDKLHEYMEYWGVEFGRVE